MNVKKYLRDIAITIPVTFVVATVVIFLYNLLVHGSGMVEWETAFQLAFIVGMVLPMAKARNT